MALAQRTFPWFAFSEARRDNEAKLLVDTGQ
jgi:hypothetical protein